MVEHNAINQINKADVMEKMWDTLNLCAIYHPTDNGMEVIYDEWAENKGNTGVWNGMSVLDIISKHPDYVPEKGYIVKKAEYDRTIDFEIIREVLCDILDVAYMVRKEVELKPFTYMEMHQLFRQYDSIVDYCGYFDHPELVTYNGMSLSELRAERSKWKQKCNEADRRNDIVVDGDCNTFTSESYEQYKAFRRLVNNLISWINVKKDNCEDTESNEIYEPLLIDKDVFNWINDSELGIKGIREGQTFNKVMIKILTQLGFNTKWYEYNKEVARLGDASIPKKYTRFTILSANLVDYWRMSFLKNASSCHTIDKAGNFIPSRGGQNFNGIHASGTESYMFDSSSLIMYTVDENYEGNDYELQPKINRCMFHVGEGKFIMGRIYPQGKDGEKEVYKQWRNIFQTIIAECLDIPNYWKTEYDEYNKLDQIKTSGTHYPDYEMDYCNIAGWSWHKPFPDSEPSKRIIKIGHDPICPCCGDEHCVEDNLECEDCQNSENEFTEYCHDCGKRIQTDTDEYYTDGCGTYWCCLSHANYDNYYEVEDDDYVYYEGDIWYEESTNTYWSCDDEAVETADGTWFHNEDAAKDEGYIYYPADDAWYPEGDYETDALTGEDFPYWNDTYSYSKHHSDDGNDYYFVNDDNKEEWIEQNESTNNNESEVA